MTEEEKVEPLAPRKAWGDIPFQPRLLSLEVTASAMEGILSLFHWQVRTKIHLLTFFSLDWWLRSKKEIYVSETYFLKRLSRLKHIRMFLKLLETGNCSWFVGSLRN